MSLLNSDGNLCLSQTLPSRYLSVFCGERRLGIRPLRRAQSVMGREECYFSFLPSHEAPCLDATLTTERFDVSNRIQATTARSQSVSSLALWGNQTSKPVTNEILKNLLELKSGFRFSSLYIMFLIPDFTSSSFILGNFLYRVDL